MLPINFSFSRTIIALVTGVSHTSFHTTDENNLTANFFGIKPDELINGLRGLSRISAIFLLSTIVIKTAVMSANKLLLLST